MGKTRRRLKAITAVAGLFLLAAFCSGCTLSEPGHSKAALSFKKEIRETADVLAPSLIEAVSNRDQRTVNLILEGQCGLAREKGRPFTCGITVLDSRGITLASVTPSEAIRRLHYSRNEAVMHSLERNRAVTAKLYLQDGTVLYVVGIPLTRTAAAEGLLVLSFDARELKDRIGITEKEFLSIDLSR